jgi:hypothetical protein
MNDKPPNLPAIPGARPTAIIPTDFDGVWRLSTAIAKSGITPRELKEPEKIMVAIMHGMEIGLSPMQSLQRIAIINGRPTIWGDAAIGLIRASGKLDYIKEWIEGEGDAMVAHCEMKRKGDPYPVTATFSVDDAKAAGLWSPEKTVKKKDWDTKQMVEKPNDSPWHRFPKRMLQMRARAWPARDTFADVLGGLSLREEFTGLEEVEALEVRDVQPKRIAPPPDDDEGAPSSGPSKEGEKIVVKGKAGGEAIKDACAAAPPPDDEDDAPSLPGLDAPRIDMDGFRAAIAKATDAETLLAAFKYTMEPGFDLLPLALQNEINEIYNAREAELINEGG